MRMPWLEEALLELESLPVRDRVRPAVPSVLLLPPRGGTLFLWECGRLVGAPYSASVDSSIRGDDVRATAQPARLPPLPLWGVALRGVLRGTAPSTSASRPGALAAT